MQLWSEWKTARNPALKEEENGHVKRHVLLIESRYTCQLGSRNQEES